MATMNMITPEPNHTPDAIEEDLGSALQRAVTPQFLIGPDSKSDSAIVSPELESFGITTDLMIRPSSASSISSTSKDIH